MNTIFEQSFDFVWGMVEREMQKAGWTKNFLLDGFPRSQENNEQWQQKVSSKFNFGCLIHFDSDEETVKERIMKRGETSGRIDDNMESLMKRLQAFNDDQVPIIESYAAEGKVKTINADQEEDKVYTDLTKELAWFL